ncbi:MAG TPA: uroporphyrinogen-III synthase [Planktothrix sp.]|jgi:uroporphyrinogen-III synthase
MSADAKPLDGARVLVTRSQEQAPHFCAQLEALGALVYAVPVISIEGPADWQPVDEALRSLDRYNWIVFASSNAARFFVERSRQLGVLAQLKHTPVAAIGPSTARALAQNEIIAAFVPSQSIAEQFVIEFPQRVRIREKKILWPRGNLGRMLIAEALTEQGAVVEAVECYRNTPPKEQNAAARELATLLKEKKLTHVVLTSGQSAKSFADLAVAGLAGRSVEQAIEYEDRQAEMLADFVRDVIVASIGPETSRACREFIGKVDVEAAVHTIDGLCEALSNQHLET